MSLNKKLTTVCYFGIGGMHYSRNKVFSNALKNQGVTILECITQETGLKRYVDLYKKHKEIKNKYDALIVGFPGFVVAPFARLVTKKKVILDALSSRYDSDIVSRNAHNGNFFRKLKILFIDWLAFVSSHLILVETKSQKDFMTKKFWLSNKKVAVVYTGVDEEVFKQKEGLQKHDVFTVLFRGRIMNEAGVPTILKAAEVLKNEDIHFDIIGYGWGEWVKESREIYQRLDHTKVTWKEEEIPIEELVERSQKAHISLGQFGKSERVDRTIPHKAFEAMVLGVPYLTARSKAVSEILTDKESCIMIGPIHPQALADAILNLKKDVTLREKLAVNARRAYDEHCSSKKIGDILIRHIESLL